jgi:hypothetical protein
MPCLFSLLCLFAVQVTEYIGHIAKCLPGLQMGHKHPASWQDVKLPTYMLTVRR